MSQGGTSGVTPITAEFLRSSNVKSNRSDVSNLMTSGFTGSLADAASPVIAASSQLSERAARLIKAAANDIKAEGKDAANDIANRLAQRMEAMLPPNTTPTYGV